MGLPGRGWTSETQHQAPWGHAPAFVSGGSGPPGSARAGTGNGGANRITGNALNNTLDGGDGADTLNGGLGDDTYITDGLDTLVEAAGGGTDTVVSALDFNLSNVLEIENLTLTGGAVTGTGNGVANRLLGNDLANTLI